MSEKRSIDDVEDDTVMSLQDIINEDSELETMANAVLGGSDDQACTYSDGYVSRQALYACATCKTVGNAGICLACSLECHDGHELYELYTKRNFRCDCGNSKFPDNKCKLYDEKQPLNDNNSYNQNFDGTYCSCKRPYPDPENDEEDEMIQCVVCEDWYHSRHLIGKPPTAGFAEMICQVCMKQQAKVLWYYAWNFEPEDCVVNVTSVDDSKLDSGLSSSVMVKDENAAANSKDDNSQTKCPDEASTSSQKIQSPPKHNRDRLKPLCLSTIMKMHESQDFPDKAVYLPDCWRKTLCPCADCKSKLSEVDFLYSNRDTMDEYEKRGTHKYSEPSVVSGMKALSEMNRVHQVEVIHGYYDMKDRLSAFLRTFADQGKVVTEQDIRNFFQRMSEAKRPRLDLTHSCR